MGVTTVAEMKRRFERLDIEEITVDAMEQVPDELAELNREQLFDGKYVDGSYITPPYTLFTIEQKKIKGQPYNRVTLNDAGSYHQKLHLLIQGKQYDFVSKDSKAAKIDAKYGTSGDLYGISDEKKGEAGEMLQPHMVRGIAKQTGAKYG